MFSVKGNRKHYKSDTFLMNECVGGLVVQVPAFDAITLGSIPPLGSNYVSRLN